MESAFNDTLIANVTTGTASAVSRVVNYKDSSGVRIDSTGEMAGYNTQALNFTQHLDENGVSYLGNTNAVLWPDTTSNNWIATSRIFSGSYWQSAYGNGIFVAVGADGAVASNDGLRWQRATPLSGDTDFSWMWDLRYGGNLFLMVGNSGRVATSKDGLKWTLQTAPSISGAWSIAFYGNGLYIIGSTTGDIATSTDGITWTARTGTFSSSSFFIFYLNGLYFITGENGELATSPDGITWTARTSSFGTSAVRAITYDAGLFVAVGNDGKIATSPDGFAWTQRTSPTSNQLRSVEKFAGVYVATGLGGSIITSPDGVTWTARTSGFGTSNIFSTIEFKGILVVGGDASVICTSTDGITWVSHASNASSNPVVWLSQSAERLVGVCNGGVLISSTDGATWIQEPVAASGIQAVGWVYSANQIAASNVAGQTYYSKDGCSWTLGASPNSGVTNAFATFLTLGTFAVGDGGSLAYSTNGTGSPTWTSVTSSFGTSNIYGVAADNTGIMVAVGAGGKLARATSPFSSWTQQTSSFGTDDIFGVAWSTALGLFIAVGANGKLATSPNGTTWTQRTSSFGTTTIGYVAVIGGTVVVAAGYGSTMVASSTDGTTWTQRTNTTAGYGLFASSSKFVLLGADAYADSSDGTTWTAHTHDQFKGTFYAGVYGNLGGGAALLVAGNTVGGITVSAEGAFIAGHTINGVVLSPGEGANGVVAPMVPSSGIVYSAGEVPPRLLPNSTKIAFNSTGNIVGPVLSDRIVRSLAAGTVSNDLTATGALSCGLLTSYISPSVYTEVSSAYHTDYTRKLNNLVAGTGHKLTLAQAVDFAFPLLATTANITHLAVFHTSSGALAWVVPLPSTIPSGTTVAHYQFPAGAFTLDFADASTVAP